MNSYLKKLVKSFKTNIPLNIPFPFPSLGKHIPGLMRGTYYCITAASGVGKTQLTKYLTVTSAIDYAEYVGLDYHLLYFCLEESKAEFYDSIRIHELVKRFQLVKDPDGKEINQYYLNGEYGKIHPEIQAKLDEVEPYVEAIKKYVTVIDSVNNPTGIYKYVKSFADSRGKHYYKNTITGEVIEEHDLPKNDLESGKFIYDHYEPKNKREIIGVVLDHMNILAGEKDYKDLASAMGLMSTQYFLPKIVKRFNYFVCSVQQQVMSGEGLDYVKAGMLYPSQEKLGDNKMIGRDYPIIIGLFNPSKHKDKLTSYEYDLKFFDDNIRVLNVIKHRKGKGMFEIPLFFDGRAQRFSELPHHSNRAGIRAVMDEIEDARKSGRL